MPFSVRDLVRVPGLISLSRVPIAALFPWALRRHRALTLLALAGLTDVADGWVARRFHQETTTGALVDGVADKVFALGVVTSLAAAGALSLGEIALLGTRELGEVALGVRLAVLGRRRARRRPRRANASGKAATTLQYAALAAVITGSRHRRALIGVAAIAGVIASASYWRRELAVT